MCSVLVALTEKYERSLDSATLVFDSPSITILKSDDENSGRCNKKRKSSGTGGVLGKFSSVEWSEDSKAKSSSLYKILQKNIYEV